MKIKHIKYKIQDLIIFYNNAHLVICEGWHFTHMWKILVLPHDFTKRFGPIKLVK